MRYACDLALRGSGKVSPNPRVGAVIVRDNQSVSEGWHDAFGGIHAEAHALQSFDGITNGAVLYVTLEPCAHVGKQPACTNAILASGITTVVIGMRDPNPAVMGGGADFLRAHGITVIEHVATQECAWINRFFTTWVTQHRPYIIAKIATTIDGCASATIHDDRWITTPASRSRVHALRSEVDCVLTGIGTVTTDDPLLNVRLVPGRHPVRAVLDSMCSISPSTAIVRTAKDIPTIIMCSSDAAASPNADVLRTSGCTVLPLATHNERLSIGQAICVLQERAITSIMVEAGPTLTASFVQGGFVDEIEMHVGSESGGSDNRWDVSCISPDPALYILHHETRMDGDLHRVFIKASA